MQLSGVRLIELCYYNKYPSHATLLSGRHAVKHKDSI